MTANLLPVCFIINPLGTILLISFNPACVMCDYRRTDTGGVRGSDSSGDLTGSVGTVTLSQTGLWLRLNLEQ